MPTPVLAPRISVNEPDMQVTAVCVTEGEWVEPEQTLCVLETTKAAVDVVTERAGYVAGLQLGIGDFVTVGQLLCTVAETPPPPRAAAQEGAPGPKASLAAVALAKQHGIDLGTFRADRIITESLVRERLAEQAPADLPLRGPLVVYGAGHHAVMVVELLRQLPDLELVGLLDDGLPEGTERFGLRVLGGQGALSQLHQDGIRLAANAIGALPQLRARLAVSRLLGTAGFTQPPLVHPRAIVEPSARLAPGVQVFAGAQVGAQAMVERDAIINTGAIVSHDCVIRSGATLSPGCILASGVEVGERAILGMGALVNASVRIGADCRVGNGAILNEEVPPSSVVNAGALWPLRADHTGPRGAIPMTK